MSARAVLLLVALLALLVPLRGPLVDALLARGLVAPDPAPCPQLLGLRGQLPPLARPLLGPTPTSVPLTVSTPFEGGLELTRWTLPCAAVAGETLRGTLRWRARERPSHDVLAWVQVAGPGGVVADWGEHTTHEGRTTTGWAPGEEADEPFTLALPPRTPAGSYPVVVGLYDTDLDRPLLVGGRRALEVGQLRVER